MGFNTAYEANLSSEWLGLNTCLWLVVKKHSFMYKELILEAGSAWIAFVIAVAGTFSRYSQTCVTKWTHPKDEVGVWKPEACMLVPNT